MIFILYKLYSNECKMEGFEATTQSVGGIDDVNAINTLAQISKQLMTSGLTVPGNMTITGNTNVTGDSKVAGALGVTGNTELKGTLDVTGITTIKSPFNVTDVTTLGKTLNVTGLTTLSGLNVNGPLKINTMNPETEINQIKTDINKMKSFFKKELRDLIQSAATFMGGGGNVVVWGQKWEAYNVATA